MTKASQTGGVKPMSIGGRLMDVRERTIGMTDAERAFRKQWVKDQQLAKNEPVHVPEMYEALNNPIKRFYKRPLNKFEALLVPLVGANRAGSIRYYTGKILMGIAGAYLLTYYLKYNTNDWTRTNGIRILKSREACLPGDPDFPCVSQRCQGSDYADRGFNSCKLAL
ncbi:unnamed protein product [Psylliodes chrysocephalus]|uniref:NADH dehydrogenase [ubiquinone] 1 beta subcomplex subunit 6 n=1 Tax=Psylliodes chrysocephalus TaxID=3402493 RepID=A0A9P0DC13_9CUCU|nr:unnamed protein product [Psylliodes chrysocephala]